VCEHLVDQKLLASEAEADAGAPEEYKEAAAAQLAEVRKKYSSEQAFQAALTNLGMDEQPVLARLTEQQRILHIVDQRLRPAAAPDDSEVQTYYRETFVPEYLARNGGPAPPLDQVESQIHEILVQQKINQLLTTWLDELRASRQVRFYAFD
jgi:hypothetical protein